MADEPEKTGTIVLRSVITASAGAAAVFVLDRFLFRRDEKPFFTAVEDLDKRVNRLENLALQARREVPRQPLPPE